MARILLWAATVLIALSTNAAANERLRTYYDLKLVEAGIPVRLSYGPLSKYGRIETRRRGEWTFRAFPTLGYESNFNGGIGQDSVSINGIPFTVAPEQRSVEDSYAGLFMALGGYYVLEPGHRLTFDLTGQYARGLTTDLDTLSANLSACYAFDASNWTYLNLCASTNYAQKDLSIDRVNAQRITLGKVFDTGAYPSALELGLSKVESDSAQYDQASLDYHLITDSFSLDAGVSASIAKSGQAPDHSVYGTLTKTIFGRPISASLRHTRSSGGTFLGLQREEKQNSVSLSMPLNRKISFVMGYSRTTSPIEYFEKEEFTARFAFTQF